ncbi:NAD(P)H-dependent oxidoreductase [Flavobacterium selenitireducens]|uniref:NAD(P)H-dependent oxidoreductase n=1 Tax=Flavobacterium selenitireducens TaxID=2722704 RepID=UPI00168BE0BD|nr:NAD(P)H-dependent oxidoreductase [Flavobacterium selenitireducens]MBD3583828.1 NAD(P)H-dependent oxidoreductase [Flavobacterium selenitireducens]
MNTFISDLNWRYATKKYDASRTISPEDLDVLKQAVRYSASSYGLQPYRVLIIKDKAIRSQLAEVSFSNKDSILKASHLFVLANIKDVDHAAIDAYIDNMATTRNVERELLAGFESFLKSAFSEQTPESRSTWASKQTYIALANLLSAAASLKLDATPMEGFQKAAYDEILNLGEIGLTASVAAVVGYRDHDDPAQHLTKVRKPEQELFITL